MRESGRSMDKLGLDLVVGVATLPFIRLFLCFVLDSTQESSRESNPRGVGVLSFIIISIGVIF